MTKKKVIIITSIAITLFILLSSICFLCIKKEIHKNDSSDSTLIKSSIEQNDNQLNVSDNNIQESQIEVKEQEEQKEVKSSEEKKNTNNETKKDNTSIQTEIIKKEEQQPFEEPKKEEPIVQPTQPVQQPVNNSGPWDEYGISEYDYYHKPMWSWARIDYSISTYGSYEATHQACIDAGNQIEDAFSFSCTNINSYSGDYLGDMLRVKY